MACCLINRKRFLISAWEEIFNGNFDVELRGGEGESNAWHSAVLMLFLVHIIFVSTHAAHDPKLQRNLNLFFEELKFISGFFFCCCCQVLIRPRAFSPQH